MMEWYHNITFANKEAFFLLLVLPFMVAWYIWGRKRNAPDIKLSTLSFFRKTSDPVMHGLRHSPFVFRSVGVLLLIGALARPRSSSNWEDVTTQGIDIVMAQDVSASMLARDFDPNRLSASKEVAAEFIKNRPNDRIGLVVYEGQSFTQCPLTSDHRVLLDLLRDTRTGLLRSGTAIGMGLATAVNRLKDSEAKSKVVILLMASTTRVPSLPSPQPALLQNMEYGCILSAWDPMAAHYRQWENIRMDPTATAV